GDDPDVHAARPRAAHRLELALLQDAKKLSLELERKLANLVEEDGPPVRKREAALATGGGTGEGAALVAEELALDQRGGDGCAVHLHQRLVPAAAALVDGPGEELLPGPGLAEDEHRRVRRRDLAHLGERVEERGAVSEDLPRAPEVSELGAEVLGLAGQGGDPPLRLEPLVDVPEDEREVPSPVQLEQRQRPLGEEGAAAELQPGEAAGDPGAAGVLRAALQLTEQGLELGRIAGADQRGEGHPAGVLVGGREGALRGRVHPRHPQLAVQLDDGVEGALDESGQLRLTGPDLALHPEAAELGRGTTGEEDR